MNDEGFLRELLTQPDDRTTRLVYADWLDERDDPRGEFLRLEMRLEDLPRLDEEREALLVQLRELREAIDIEWLARLDRARIENCLRFAFACPQRWEQLRPTGDTLVRFCDSCRKSVHYCGTVAEAREHAGDGHCVAVDSRLARVPGDLLSGDPLSASDDLVGLLDFEDPPHEEHFALGLRLSLDKEGAPPSPPPPPTRKWWQFWKRSR